MLGRQCDSWNVTMATTGASPYFPVLPITTGQRDKWAQAWGLSCSPEGCTGWLVLYLRSVPLCLFLTVGIVLNIVTILAQGKPNSMSILELALNFRPQSLACSQSPLLGDQVQMRW